MTDYQRLYEERLLTFGASGIESKETKLMTRIESQLVNWQDQYPDVCKKLRDFILDRDKQSLGEVET